MLPTNYYHGPDRGQYGDKPFLIEWLSKLNKLPKTQKQVSDRYSEIYAKLVKEDPDKCRFRANTWLRKSLTKIREDIRKKGDGLPF